MSNIDLEKLKADIEQYRNEVIQQYVDEHDEPQARALEAFIKTGLLLRAVVQSMLNDEHIARVELRELIVGLISAYADYMLGHYCESLALNDEAIKRAATTGHKVLEELNNRFESVFQEHESKTGRPTIQTH